MNGAGKQACMTVAHCILNVKHRVMIALSSHICVPTCTVLAKALLCC